MPQDPQSSSYTKKCPTCLGAGCSWQRAGDDYVAMPCDTCHGAGSILVLVTPAPSGREVLALDRAALVNVPATPIAPVMVTTTAMAEPIPPAHVDTTTAMGVQTSPRILHDTFGQPVGGYSWGAK